MSFSAWEKRAFLLLAVGFFLLVISLLFPLLYWKLFEMIIYRKISLVNGTELYSYWKAIPFPISQRLYFFNITNPGDFLNSGAKLKITEVGPYTYRSKWVKDILGWHKNGTVSYLEVKTYHFLPEKSNGTEDDVIVSFNGPMIAAAKELETYNLMSRKAASIWLRRHSENVIIEKTVRELTYGGYKDPIVKYAPYIKPLKPDSPFRDGKFAWLYGLNGSDDGIFTVFTGQHDLSKLNVIDNWNGVKTLAVWDGEKCNMINGTTGEFGPPLKHDQKFYTFFMPALCRSFTFERSAQETVRGVYTLKFVATQSTLGSSRNTCFRTVQNLPSGIHDIGPCKPAAPVVISYPHFYLSDPSFVQLIEGLNPQAEDHYSYINLEPKTGFGVSSALRLQVNLVLKRIKGVRQFENIPEGIFPVYWGEMFAVLPEEYAKILEFYLSGSKIAYHCVLGLVICMSIMMISVGTGMMISAAFKRQVTVNFADIDVSLLKDCAQTHAGKSNGFVPLSKFDESLEDSNSMEIPLQKTEKKSESLRKPPELSLNGHHLEI